jgi:ribosomal protein S27E
MAHIYEFADFKIDRKPDMHGWTSRFADKESTECIHRQLTFDENGHTVQCQVCGKEVSAWWAFMSLVETFQQEWDRLKTAQAEVQRAEARVLTHKAAIYVEDAWRRRKTIPGCPHCHKPILPGDRFGSIGLGVSTRFSEAPKPMEFKSVLELVGDAEKTE